MTVPVRGRGSGGSPKAFSVRTTAGGFGAVALLICGGGLMVRIAWEGMLRHPAAVVLASAGVLLLYLRRTRRRPRGGPGPLSEAVQELFEPPQEPGTSPSPEFRPLHDDDGMGRTAVLPEPEPLPEQEWEPAGPEEETQGHEALDATGFEDAIAALCERDGCSDVQVVGGAGDLGADVIATAPDGRRLVVQCKYYGPDNKVGSQDLQRFGGTCYAVHEAEIAVCVTTSAYTTPALEYAEQCAILCVDGEALVAWNDGTAPPPWL
ncbi:restriction endonuclease [Streptomyces sp. ITFR-6]|uniref:restriction endonuclease n=1 Tax=Streptomyces sp. ITFR-6 TaxID=3075197 RepID=UPI00288960CF|nr:restriction endonuclease [Streptomyces sp. ITFR-6]WNI28151.1 restriction endonuclease [Streptomyces sp. ITFR-6]